MYSAELIDKTDGNYVIALFQHTLGDIIAAWGILITRLSNLLAVQIGYIAIEQGTQQQAGRFSCMLLINRNMLSQPNATCAAPGPVVLINLLP